MKVRTRRHYGRLTPSGRQKKTSRAEAIEAKCCGFLDMFVKLRKSTMSFVKSVCLSVCLCVRPPVSIEQFGPVDGFSLNLVYQYFSNICRENSRLIQISPTWVLYIKT